MDAHAQPFEFLEYKELLVILLAAGVIIPVFHRLGISSVLGFLLTGILIGPSVLGQFIGEYPWLRFVTIEHPEDVRFLAELGIAFLLFMIGIELSFGRLLTMRRLVFGLGGLQVTVSSLLIALVAYALGLPPTEAAILGLALSLSSTAIVIQLLSDERRLGTLTGRKSFAILLMQDLAVVPILLFTSSLGTAVNGNMVVSIIIALAEAVAGLAVIYIVGRYLLRPLLRMVAGTRSADLFMAATLLIIVAAGLAAAFSGLSMAIGAFMAGLLLAETEYRREIEAIIEPFKGLMLGAFFMLVGMGMDLGNVVAHPLTILGLAAGLIALKVAILLGIGLLMRFTPASMIETALLLGPGGEFAFVILAAAAAAGLVSPVANKTALVVVSISMLAIPLFARMGGRVTQRLVRKGNLPPEALVPPPYDENRRVIVVGFGRVGKTVCDMLDEVKLPYLAIEQDPEIVAKERASGRSIYYGDASRPDFLRRCGISTARAVAVTVNSPSKATAIVQAAKNTAPNVHVIARARDERHAIQLYGEGVTEAVPETTEAALQLGEAVLVESGIAMGLAIASVHERRDRLRKRLGRPDRRADLRLGRARKVRDASQADEPG